MIDFEAVAIVRRLSDEENRRIWVYVFERDNPLTDEGPLLDDEVIELNRNYIQFLENKTLCDHLNVNSEEDKKKIFAYTWFTLGYDKKFRVPVY